MITGDIMENTEQEADGWESAAHAALRDLSTMDMPGLEILFLDDLAGWVFSINNPGHGYDETHGAAVVTILLQAIERAGSFRPVQVPADSDAIVAMRERVVAGAHGFAGSAQGVTRLVGLLAPAAVRELERSADQPAAQTYWLYHWGLLVLASGGEGDVSEETLRGISDVFQAWEALVAAGFVLPWRRQGMASQASVDMVTSYVETLIERLTGAEKAKVDPDGDYPIRYRSALYFVRVVPARKPVVQIFSVAVDDVQLTDSLARELNDINGRLHFCRAFWVRGQILVEAEHLGGSLSEADFEECARNVAEATDAFAKGLAERHGGRLAFEKSKEPGYAPQAEERIGYL
jgi:T3SS (YopN, CesT) and YbjN peptide-binding chaperone 1